MEKKTYTSYSNNIFQLFSYIACKNNKLVNKKIKMSCMANIKINKRYVKQMSKQTIENSYMPTSSQANLHKSTNYLKNVGTNKLNDQQTFLVNTHESPTQTKNNVNQQLHDKMWINHQNGKQCQSTAAIPIYESITLMENV